MFEEGCKFYIGEINVVVRGVKVVGVIEIVVMDCYGVGEGYIFNLLILEDFDLVCEYVV